MSKSNTIKLSVVLLVTLMTGLIVGNQLGYSEGVKWREDKDNSFKKVIEAELIDETLKNNPPPECHATNCPEYTFFDADGDGLNESIVTEYTTMTQQAGRIWIIDDGRVVFKSEEKAQISVGPNKDTQGNPIGLVIGYNTTYQLSPDFLDSFKSDYYEFRNGKFVMTKTVDHIK